MQKDSYQETFHRLLPMVERIAQTLCKRRPVGVLDDLVQAGSVGLLETLQRHLDDPALEGFAFCRVRGAMIDHLRSLDPLNRRQNGVQRRLSAARSRLCRDLGDEPTPEQVAEEAGVTLEEYEAARVDRAARRPPAPVLSLWPDEAPAALDVLEQAAELDVVHQAVETLEEPYRTIVTQRYLKGRRMTELAKELGVSAGRVSQLLGSALDELRVTSARAI